MNLAEIIKQAASNAISYVEYRKLVEDHVINQTNTGDQITEALAEYTKLNHQRMRRLDKTLKLLLLEIRLMNVVLK